MNTKLKRGDDIIVAELEAAPGVTYIQWPEYDMAVLRKYYGKKSTYAIAKYLGRSVSATQRKAERMGLTRPGRDAL